MEDAIATGWLLAGASLIAATWVGVDGAGAADAVSYRGPQNNGIYEETGLVKAWPADGPRFLWKRMLGQAYGGASVSDGIVWIASDARGCLYGFTLDGELRYKHPFGSTTWKRFTGPRCTPLIRDGIGVVARPNADIYAMDLTTAEKRWSVNAWKGFGSGKGDMGWGYPSSSVAFEDTVILNTATMRLLRSWPWTSRRGARCGRRTQGKARSTRAATMRRRSSGTAAAGST
jgi:hypothetical protein